MTNQRAEAPADLPRKITIPLDEHAAMRVALAPLALIAARWRANALDESRPEAIERGVEAWRRPCDVILFQGRGGAELLTLADALEAERALAGDFPSNCAKCRALDPAGLFVCPDHAKMTLAHVAAVPEAEADGPHARIAARPPCSTYRSRAVGVACSNCGHQKEAHARGLTIHPSHGLVETKPVAGGGIVHECANCEAFGGDLREKCAAARESLSLGELGNEERAVERDSLLDPDQIKAEIESVFGYDRQSLAGRNAFDYVERKIARAAHAGCFRRHCNPNEGAAPVNRWPFRESPGEFANRIFDIYDNDNRGRMAMLAAVRFVLIEEPPALAAWLDPGAAAIDSQKLFLLRTALKHYFPEFDAIEADAIGPDDVCRLGGEHVKMLMNPAIDRRPQAVDVLERAFGEYACMILPKLDRKEHDDFERNFAAPARTLLAALRTELWEESEASK